MNFNICVYRCGVLCGGLVVAVHISSSSTYPGVALSPTTAYDISWPSAPTFSISYARVASR